MNEKKLVVISQSLGRSFRFLLASSLYTYLKDHFDVVVLTPFSQNDSLNKDFGGPNVRFLHLGDPLSDKIFLIRALYTVTEFLRSVGYRFRYRKQITGWQWMNFKAERGRLLAYLFGVLGWPSFSWRLVESIFGGLIFSSKMFANIINGYQDVLLVHCANWGMQDRQLAYLGRKFNLKSIFFPYTTDQLCVNGHLLADFNKIFIQGPREKEFISQFHKDKNDRVCPLGMLWLRTLDENTDKIKEKTKRKKVLLYAGGSSRYYPNNAEQASLDRILLAIDNGELKDFEILYQPVITNDDERELVEQKYATNPHVKIAYPSDVFIGVNTYRIDLTISEHIENYAKKIKNVDLVMMSGISTIFFDAFYYDKPVIVNYYDPDDVLLKAGVFNHIVDDSGYFKGVGGKMRVVNKLSEFPGSIKTAIADIRGNGDIKNNILCRWDYNHKDYLERFINALEEIFASPEKSWCH